MVPPLGKYESRRRDDDDEEDEEESLDHSTIMRANQSSLSRKQMIKHASIRYQEKEEAKFQLKHKQYMKHKKRGLFVLDLIVLVFSFVNVITEALAFHSFLQGDASGVAGAQGFACVISAVVLVGRAVNDGRWMIPYVRQMCSSDESPRSRVDASWRGAISVLQLVLEDFLVILVHRIVTTSKNKDDDIIGASCVSLLASSMSTLTILVVALYCLATTAIEYWFLRRVKRELRQNAKKLSHLKTKRDLSRKLILPGVCFVLSLCLFAFSAGLLNANCFLNDAQSNSTDAHYSTTLDNGSITTTQSIVAMTTTLGLNLTTTS
ncbi:hypothetical protein CAPTEDRAFT_224622 [Capitella teleta]|uniref:Uncharacterized protein n=1 Tax=Capitella teleta TaxID=283909 RepID=R7VEP5_CAPTE|nr:hypothetical protein CAPTEDRAFT_224622 [Capitella teleta]|eukprot:ELU14140.1 hypothetical protein CAPTEDRAFT_224622 [Capitella teleta]